MNKSNASTETVAQNVAAILCACLNGFCVAVIIGLMAYS